MASASLGSLESTVLSSPPGMAFSTSSASFDNAFRAPDKSLPRGLQVSSTNLHRLLVLGGTKFRGRLGAQHLHQGVGGVELPVSNSLRSGSVSEAPSIQWRA